MPLMWISDKRIYFPGLEGENRILLLCHKDQVACGESQHYSPEPAQIQFKCFGKNIMHLQKLIELVASEKKTEPFICILDLVENGLSEDRFATDDDIRKPSRHEITLFIAAWCRYVGFEPEMCRDWLTGYCMEVLSKISSSTLSQIRHSTKSSIKYIHRSEVPFSCNCENNLFKAHCSVSCPIYDEMKELYLQQLADEQKKRLEYQRIAEEDKPEPKPLTVTQKYEKQYLEAIAIIEEDLKKGHTKKDIAIILNEKKYKTRRGLKWTAQSVSNLSVSKGWSPKRKKPKKKTASVQMKLF